MKPLLLLLACLLTACGHIEYQPLATIDHVDHSRGYRLQHVFHDQQDDDLFLVLLFSGGGTRAAAFGYGVLGRVYNLDLPPLRSGGGLGRECEKSRSGGV